ncbi:MAG TPA: AsmA family protein, partial [Xanthobacteraceae bacterium]|nr:AsmA family protein [Xanthobacteraceae bacterium]
MQTTLLGVAIAAILALVAALVGPHFVDWSQYRSVFEVEASRLVGMPVRVTGPIDARLLPTPSVVLRGIETGQQGDEANVQAAELGMVLSLGPLVRGEVRAAEVRLVAPEFKLSLNEKGQFNWRNVAIGLDPDQISIERFAIENGRAVLSDGTSGTSRVLEKLWFNGEIRSLLGPARGEGGFLLGEDRYGYRLTAGRVAEDGTVKLRLALDPTDRPLTFEADGVLRLDAGTPEFAGTLTLARPAGLALATGGGLVSVPWRSTSKVKANARSALFEQVEFQYGPDEQATRLTGAAELKFGRAPRFDGVLSARQVDLDRALGLPEPLRNLPLAGLRALIEALDGMLTLPIPARLGIGIDALTLGRGTVQALRGDLTSDGRAWNLETLEFRAPGFTRVRLSGRVGLPQQAAAYKGLATVEANDPRALFAWIEGRTDPQRIFIGSLRASGDVSLALDQVSIERMRADFEGKTLEGRLAYGFAGDARPSRLEAQLRAGEFDVDGAVTFVRAALGNTTFALPDEALLSIELGRAKMAGVEATNVETKLRVDANGLTVERISVGDLAGAAVDISGRLDKWSRAPNGNLTFDVSAKDFDGALALFDKFAPGASQSVRKIARHAAPSKLHASLELSAVAEAEGSTTKLALDGTAGSVRIQLTADGVIDAVSMKGRNLKVEGQFSADDGTALVAMLDLDRAITVDKRPGMLKFVVRGPSDDDLRVDAQLTAGGLVAAADGTMRLFGANRSAMLRASMTAADFALLRPHTSGLSPEPVPLTLRTRLTMNPAGDFIADELTATVASSSVRGKLGFAFGSPLRLEGHLDVDTISASAALAMGLGMPERSANAGDTHPWPSEPFVPRVLEGMAGTIDFTVARAQMTSGLVAQQVRGRLTLNDSEIAFDGLQGNLAGGRLSGALAVRRAADGLSAQGRLSLVDVEARDIIPAGARPAVTGRLNLHMQGQGTGLSPAALVGSLNGTGTISIKDVRIAAMDPRIFEFLIRKVDQGISIDPLRIGDTVAAALESGSLGLRDGEGTLTLVGGQIRLPNMSAAGEGADLTVAAAIDLAQWLLDARLTLSAVLPAAEVVSVGRPEVLVALKGPIFEPKRTVDVSALSGWLVLRAVDRQTRHLESIEANRSDAPSGATGSTSPLAPAAVRPVPQVPRSEPGGKTSSGNSPNGTNSSATHPSTTKQDVAPA